jgi:hypothetical protein
MKWRVLAYMTVSLLALTACQLFSNLTDGTSPVKGPATQSVSKPASGSSNGAARDYQYIFDAPSEPIRIHVALDEAKSVEATVPVEGGTLRASGTDGSTYILDIPPDALLNETRIKMTPAASVSGLPFGGEQTYAVKLEPEGLFFNNFVTLTIVPPQELPIDQQIFFGYQADGEDLVLAAADKASAEIKLKLLHFSGAGVTKGLLADIEPVRQRLGGSAEQRLQNLAAEVLGRERQRQLLGQGEGVDLAAIFNDLMKQYEEQVVQPRVAAAGESCAAGRLALQTVLGLERQRQLLGIGGDDAFSQRISGLMKTVAQVCVKEEYELCSEQHIIHRMIPVWLGLERQYQLLGVSEGGATTPELEEAKNLAVKCLTFELNFESDGNFDDGSGGGYESIVKSKVKLQLNPDELKIKGQAPLVNDSFEFKVPGCSVSNDRGGSTFEGLSLAYVADSHSPTDELGYVRDFKLAYWPGTTAESFTVKCPDDPPYTSPPNGLWSGLYLVLHYPELDTQGANVPAPIPDYSGMLSGGGAGVPVFSMPQMPAGAGYIAEDWEVTGGEYFAKKEWIKEQGDLGLTEAGTLKLYHRPGG